MRENPMKLTKCGFLLNPELVRESRMLIPLNLIGVNCPTQVVDEDDQRY